MVASAEKANEGDTDTHTEGPVAIRTLLHDPKFAVAFGPTPNEHTPRALVLFITQKCVHEGEEWDCKWDTSCFQEVLGETVRIECS